MAEGYEIRGGRKYCLTCGACMTCRGCKCAAKKQAAAREARKAEATQALINRAPHRSPRQ